MNEKLKKGMGLDKKKDDKKKDDKKTKDGKKVTEEKKEDEEKDMNKNLGKFITLTDVDLEFYRGEFVCIIGDVGSGKSSLLNSIIGDLIYVSDEDIKAYGGLDKVGTDTELDDFKNKVITKEVVGEAPIQIKGSLSFVEQVPWIQNKTIRENIIFNLPFD